MPLIKPESLKMKQEKAKDKAVAELIMFNQKKDMAIADFNNEKAEKEKEIQDLENKINDLKLRHKKMISNTAKEIDDLLNKKRQAQKPIEDKKAELDAKELQLSKMQHVLNVKDIAIGKAEQSLMLKQREVNDGFARLAEFKVTASEQLEALTLAEIRAKKEKDLFMEKAKEFYEQKDLIMKEINTEKRALRERNKALNGYATSLNEKQLFLTKLEAKLKSERSAIKTAKKELYG